MHAYEVSGYPQLSPPLGGHSSIMIRSKSIKQDIEMRKLTIAGTLPKNPASSFG